jgi:hypothetical protein
LFAQSFILGYAPFILLTNYVTSVALEETKILAGFTSSYKLTKDLTASVQVLIMSTSHFRFYRSFSRNELRFNVGVDGNQSQQSTRRFSFNNTTSLGYNKTIENILLVLMLI